MDKGWNASALEERRGRPVAAHGAHLAPLCHALDTTILGTAAYSAASKGQEVIEAHDEAHDGRRHEEVYVVVRGRARFTLHGTPVAAPHGTFVKVGRKPVVLALGGPQTFEPSATEWIERARACADPQRAKQIIEGLRPGSPEAAIGEALLAARRGDTEAAQRGLEQLLGSEPALKRPLASDPDLGPLVLPRAQTGIARPAPCRAPRGRDRPGTA